MPAFYEQIDDLVQQRRLDRHQILLVVAVVVVAQVVGHHHFEHVFKILDCEWVLTSQDTSKYVVISSE